MTILYMRKLVDFLRNMCYNMCRKEKKPAKSFLRPGEHERGLEKMLDKRLYK